INGASYMCLVRLFDDGSREIIAVLYCVSGCNGDVGSGGGDSSGGDSGDGEYGEYEMHPKETIAEIVMVGPKVIISDINTYLKCFNLAQEATLIIYVDQPKPNSSDSWSVDSYGNPDVGHTFI